MVLKTQFVFPFSPLRGFSLILFLFFEHISIATWAKEHANPCDSAKFSIFPNQVINIVGLSVVGRGQCSRGEVGGGSCLQLTFEAVRETESEGPHVTYLFRAADQLPEGI